MFWIATVVFVIVIGLMAYAVLSSRRKTKPQYQVRWGEPVVAVGGAALPFIVLAALFIVSLRAMDALSSPPDEPSFDLEIVGHDWWWEVRYPNGAVTANEIHIPVGETVRIEATTADVIHSFWVPQLQVKIDLVPGRTNSIWIKADEEGRYRGQCAEFCGLQHANMGLYVVAEGPGEFERWLTNEARVAEQPTGTSEITGLEVFLGDTCVGCHTIRGTSADAEAGPDLTHLAGRRTIAAGTLRNTRSNLRRLILDPGSVKPGIAMPPTELSDDDIEALLDYLEGLE